MKVVILNFESFFQIGQGRSEFLSASENASEVVIGDSSVSISLFSKHLSLAKEFKSNIEVFFLKETHRQNVANYSRFAAGL